MTPEERKRRLDAAAGLCDAAAEELELAARHYRTAARHFREQEVPRAGAHAWAGRGHLVAAQESLDAQARAHAEASRP